MVPLNHDAMGGKPEGRSGEWQTPDKFFKRLQKVFKFDIDLAATVLNSKCEHFIGDQPYFSDMQTHMQHYQVATDALAQGDWSFDGRFKNGWLNPPYSRVKEFAEKVLEQHIKTGMRIVLLVPNSTETGWFQDIVEQGNVILPRTRIQFDPPPNRAEKKRSDNPKGSVVAVFDKNFEYSLREYQNELKRFYKLTEWINDKGNL